MKNAIKTYTQKGEHHLRYEECGTANKQAIVLLHGFCGSAYSWHKVCPHLGDRYRLIIPQLLAMGEDGDRQADWSIEAMADAVAQLTAHLELEKVVLLGHSMGGYVALAFADQYRDRVAGLGLIHSSALPDSEEKKRKRHQDIALIESHGVEAYVQRLIPRMLADPDCEERADDLPMLVREGGQASVEQLIGMVRAMIERPDRSRVLTEADYPVLLVAGSEDQIVRPIDTFTVRRNNTRESTFGYPHILEMTFEDVGHLSPVEVPEQLSRVIANYMKLLYEKEELRA